MDQRVLTVEQQQACDELAEIVKDFKMTSPVSINLHMIHSQDVPFGAQKKLYRVSADGITGHTSEAFTCAEINITDIAARATGNNYSFIEEAVMVKGQENNDLANKLCEQLYNAMYFAGYKDMINKEPNEVKLGMIERE